MKLKNQERTVGERGAAMVELAISAPLLVIFLIGVIDISRMLSSYMGLLQVAREGARRAAIEQGLEYGQFAFNSAQSNPQCSGIPANHANCVLAATYSVATSRIGNVLFVNPQTLQVQVQFQDPLYAQANDDTDSVVFVASASYDGIFQLFTGAALSVSSEAPRT